MHLLLPPSEGKTAGGRGRPLRARLGDGPLDAARRRVVEAVRELVEGDPADAVDALALPETRVGEVLEANAAVLDSPTTPALRRYSGVVYDGYDVASLAAAEQRLAARSTWIFSGLLGVVRGDEAVPNYRVPAQARLPGLGVAATFWRPVLGEVLAETFARGLIVDLRSGDYAAMWRAPRTVAPRVVAVRILSPAPRGGHAVISYTSKLNKGRLAAALVRRAAAGDPVDSAADVAAAWRAAGGVDSVLTARGIDLYTA